MPPPRGAPPPPSHPSQPPPLVPPLARRDLDENSLSGSLPTQLGALTALTHMCARRARPPPCPRRGGGRGEGARGATAHIGLARSPHTSPMPSPLLRPSAPSLPPLSPPPRWCPSRSQVPSREQPERQPAHAARRPHRADAHVRPPRSAAALPAAWGGAGARGARGATAHIGLARSPHTSPTHHHPSLSPLSPPSPHPSHPPAGASLARRWLYSNSLSGSLPTHLASLTVLDSMCARRARPPPCPRRGGRQGRGGRGERSHI